MAPHRGVRGSSKPEKGQTKSSNPSRRPKKTAEPVLENRTAHHDKTSLYQKLLDCTQSAFADVLSPSALAETLSTTLQEVKGHLYNREFGKAFSRQAYLEAYTVRWSASRALGYIHIFEDILRQLPGEAVVEETEPDDNTNDTPENRTKIKISTTVKSIICLGGGAAELCALAGVQYQHDLARNQDGAGPDEGTFDEEMRLSIRLIDVADWSPVVDTLSKALTSPRTLSPYASAASKAANVPFLSPGKLKAEFEKLDLLDSTPGGEGEFWTYVSATNLITIMFTLNELYSVSVAKTQQLLLRITESVSSGTLLLVVDSPGSYSTVTINGQEKKYPMSWLLDHTLVNMKARMPDIEDPDIMNHEEQPLGAKNGIEPAPEGECLVEPRAAWEKVMSNDSEWFRLPDGLRYPLGLENMRYQIHLFRKLRA